MMNVTEATTPAPVASEDSFPVTVDFDRVSSKEEIELAKIFSAYGTSNKNRNKR